MSKQPVKTYKMDRFQFTAVRNALSGTISRYRKQAKDEEERPSVRAMLAAEAEEMQETLDALREQDQKK
jgi:hypothetical protein